jgi:hypothetical protein
VGAPPKDAQSANHAKAMAERAAFLMANRNLLETVKGIRIDSVSLVENYVLTSDVIKTEVSGFVQGAAVTSSKTNPDGSVEVTISRKLNGDFLDMPNPNKERMSRKTVQTESAARKRDGYTGLIVDARGLRVKPAIIAHIRDDAGREVYGPSVIASEYAAQQGRMMGYVKDDASAEGSPLVAGRPLVIKAVRSDGAQHTDLVISAHDAAMLADHGAAAWLEKGRVIAIID